MQGKVRRLGPVEELLPDDQLAILTRYRNDLENGLTTHSADTSRTYLHHIATFVRLQGAAGPITLAEIVNEASLWDAITQVPAERAATRRNMCAAVKSLAAFMARIRLIDGKVAEAIANLPFRPNHQPARPHLKPEDVAVMVKKVLTAGNYNDEERVANLALFTTLVTTGLRNSELCSLKVADVDFDNGLITVTKGKGNKARIIGLPDRLQAVLQLYLKHRSQTSAPHFFVGRTGKPLTRDLVGRRLARLAKHAGIKTTAHALRRTFATTVAHKGIPLDKLQVVLGHSDIATTRAYVQTNAKAVAQEMRAW
ncbi:MAG: site-specific recombinase XerD [Rubrobacteraceae bacterium]|jgi:site-specific recombinase XerD|nr:site-specific recombinase XerD [Rubrobacteraceae bacterium]